MRPESDGDVASTLAVPQKRPVRQRLEMRPARFDDYEHIAALSVFLPSQTAPQPEWRQLWLSSPLWPELGSKWPIGWVLETASGEIVGSIENVPLLYQFSGERLIAAAVRGWVVAPGHRGRYALTLVQQYLAQPHVDLFLATSCGPMASSTGEKLGVRIPVGDWGTIAYRVTGYRRFAESALQRFKVPLAKGLAPLAGTTLQLKDACFGKALPKAHASFTIESTDRFDSRFDGFWKELLRQRADTLLAARDSATLSWHFSAPMRRGRLWILTASRNGQLRAYCILKRQDNALPRVRLVDYQTIEPDIDLLPDVLRAALRRCTAEGICVLEKAGIGVPRLRVFDEMAPYRNKQTWSFVFHAGDPTLAAKLSRPEAWDPSEYDGDASID